MSVKKLLTNVRTFATSANLGPGYDCAGMALDIYNDHEVYESTSGKECVLINGDESNSIANDRNNLICKTIRKAYEAKTGKKFEKLGMGFEIICNIGVPVERGLGSSSTAVVAGMLIANKIFNLNLSQKEFLSIGMEIEPHPDNLAPCISGGLVICFRDKGNDFDFKRIKIKDNFKVLLMIPDFKVNTNEARKLIPNSFPKEDSIANISNFALLMNSFIEGDFVGATDFINDRLHQPYRKNIYPDSMLLVDKLNNEYGLPSAISGSGPTAFAIIPNDREEEVKTIIEGVLKKQFPGFKYRMAAVSGKGSYCY